MAQKVENKKGFKVLKMSSEEIKYIGGYGICDNCNDIVPEGYYVAVLNRWFCPKCYNEWCIRATYYKDDSEVENRNFTRMQEMFEQ